jgi:NAD+ synthase
MGLSGGIDSAVLAALVVRSVGQDSVRTVYLYDRDSEKRFGLNARLVADWLGLELEARNIEPAMRDRGVYEPLFMRTAHWSGMFNRFVYRLYHLIFGETRFMSTLRVGGGTVKVQGVRGLLRSLLRLARQHLVVGFDTRHIYRREVLEMEAAAQNWLLLGAANRSEWMVGWFVKGGVDDLPLQPLKGLYKTQVRQLAAFLGAPDKVQIQPPSPDMLRGITDEFSLGMSDDKIDVALDHIEGGLPRESLAAVGVTEKELQRVREMKRLSSWKRETTSAQPPVDGGPTGGFRI